MKRGDKVEVEEEAPNTIYKLLSLEGSTPLQRRERAYNAAIKKIEREESIIDNLERIAKALERIAGALEEK